MLSRTKIRFKKVFKFLGFSIIPTFLTSILVGGYYAYLKNINKTRDIKNIFANILGLNNDSNSKDLVSSHLYYLRRSFEDSRHVASYKKQIFNNIKHFSFLNIEEDKDKDYANILQNFVYGNKENKTIYSYAGNKVFKLKTIKKNDDLEKEIAKGFKNSFKYVNEYNVIENLKKIINPPTESTRLKEIYYFFGAEENDKKNKLEIGKQNFKIFLNSFLLYIKYKSINSQNNINEIYNSIDLKNLFCLLKKYLFNKSPNLFFKELLDFYKENYDKEQDNKKDPFIHLLDFSKSLEPIIKELKNVIKKWINIDLSFLQSDKSFDDIFTRLQKLIDYIANLNSQESQDALKDSSGFEKFSTKLVDKLWYILDGLNKFIEVNYYVPSISLDKSFIISIIKFIFERFNIDWKDNLIKEIFDNTAIEKEKKVINYNDSEFSHLIILLKKTIKLFFNYLNKDNIDDFDKKHSNVNLYKYMNHKDFDLPTNNDNHQKESITLQEEIKNNEKNNNKLQSKLLLLIMRYYGILTSGAW